MSPDYPHDIKPKIEDPPEFDFAPRGGSVDFGFENLTAAQISEVNQPFGKFGDKYKMAYVAPRKEEENTRTLTKSFKAITDQLALMNSKIDAIEKDTKEDEKVSKKVKELRGSALQLLLGAHQEVIDAVVVNQRNILRATAERGTGKTGFRKDQASRRAVEVRSLIERMYKRVYAGSL